MYLDPDLLRAVKVVAASAGKHDYEVVEDALRQYIRTSEVAASQQSLQELFTQAQGQAPLTDEEALELAYSELHAARQERSRDT